MAIVRFPQFAGKTASGTEGGPKGACSETGPMMARFRWCAGSAPGIAYFLTSPVTLNTTRRLVSLLPEVCSMSRDSP